MENSRVYFRLAKLSPEGERNLRGSGLREWETRYLILIVLLAVLFRIGPVGLAILGGVNLVALRLQLGN